MGTFYLIRYVDFLFPIHFLLDRSLRSQRLERSRDGLDERSRVFCESLERNRLTVLPYFLCRLLKTSTSERKLSLRQMDFHFLERYRRCRAYFAFVSSPGRQQMLREIVRLKRNVRTAIIGLPSASFFDMPRLNSMIAKRMRTSNNSLAARSFISRSSLSTPLPAIRLQRLLVVVSRNHGNVA